MNIYKAPCTFLCPILGLLNYATTLSLTSGSETLMMILMGLESITNQNAEHVTNPITNPITNAPLPALPGAAQGSAG
jgi:hypothetical protein